MYAIQSVAQIFNLLYRRFSTCGRANLAGRSRVRTPCRLQIGDTADCKSALRRLGEVARSPAPRIATLLAITLCGCAGPRAGVVTNTRHFDFHKDTFSYPNELLWVYEFDANGKWVSHTRDPKPTYWLRCFVVTRSARQFFLNAKFARVQPIADAATYKRLIKRVISSSPRRILPEAKKIVIPGYPDLRTFSQAQEKLLKAECGGQLDSYFKRGHWRMVIPFS